MNFLVDSACKMLYLVDPHELALDETDPHPTYLLKNGPPLFAALIVSALFRRIRESGWELHFYPMAWQ